MPAAQVFDVDGFDTPRSFVSRLHAEGRYAICYIDAGTWESWRRDRSRFPDSVLGRGNGWRGERWLDIRQLDVLAPIMRDRMQICQLPPSTAPSPRSTRRGPRNMPSRWLNRSNAFGERDKRPPDTMSKPPRRSET